MTRNRSRRFERASFKLLVAVTYPLFFVTVAVSRVLPTADEAGNASVFAQALRLSEATIATAFAG